MASLAAVLLRSHDAGVPLLNLTALALHDPKEVAVLRAASVGNGVFRVSGHGIDIDAVLNASKAFFALPLEAKISTSASSGGFASPPAHAFEPTATASLRKQCHLARHTVPAPSNGASIPVAAS